MEQNRTHIAKDRMIKALEGSLGIVTTALKATDLSRTNYYKWLLEDPEFKTRVEEVNHIAKDFVLSKYYECIRDKVPSVVIHGAKNVCGLNETNRIDLSSGDEPIQINVKIKGVDY
tara:strand:- start:306 stop:653 length:348 start_codon:yes stop_codon:yes gene_type:complete